MELATAQKIAQFVTRENSGFVLNIPMDAMHNGVKITGIGMHISDDDDAGYDGDLGVSWDSTDLQNTGGGDMGSLVMRGSNDEVGRVMGSFYWDQSFDEELKAKLMEIGFSDEAASVSGSEWGMQDEERASYDANELANEVRTAMAMLAIA